VDAAILLKASMNYMKQLRETAGGEKL